MSKCQSVWVLFVAMVAQLAEQCFCKAKVACSTHARSTKTRINVIIPIAATMVNWATFIAFVQKQGYESPTRILDKEGISIDDMSAILGALGNRTALENIRKSYENKTTDYIQLIFIDDSANMGIAINSGLKVRNHGNFNIISGTLTQYIDFIIVHSRISSPLIRYANDIYTLLNKFGLKECFADYTRETHEDGIFTLRHL